MPLTLPIRPPRMPRFVRLLPILAAGACSEPLPPPPTFAPDVVLAVEFEGRVGTITAADVDAWVPTIARIEPITTLPGKRRLALTNIVLPRVVAGLIDPEARLEAQGRAQDSWDVVQEGLLEHKYLPEMEAVEGSFRKAGLDTWGLAMEMEPESWSPVFETIGAFVFFRFVAVPDGPRDSTTPILIERALFPYLDPETANARIEEAQDAAKLTIVDPEWELLVPARYRYMMDAN